MKRKDIDPVILDEVRHDRLETAMTMNFERCLVRAKEMYNFGELDDQVEDLVDHSDAVKISQAVLDYLDDYEAGNEDAHLRLPPLSIKDVRCTIEDIIERQAQMLLEDL